MNHFIRVATISLAVCIFAVVVGCGGGRSETEKNYVKELLVNVAIAFERGEFVVGGHTPRNHDELMKLIQSEGTTGAAEVIGPDLKTDKYVIPYGVDLQPFFGMPELAKSTILAYEAQTPTKGGFVVFVDKTVLELTPEEFKTKKVLKGM